MIRRGTTKAFHDEVEGWANDETGKWYSSLRDAIDAAIAADSRPRAPGAGYGVMMTTTPRRYRWIDDGRKHRVLVVKRKGWDGYVVRWTEDCFGCTEHGEYGGKQWGPFGCEECGYTGKRRREEWIPFDSTGWFAHCDRVWARVERFRSYLRSQSRGAAPGGV